MVVPRTSILAFGCAHPPLAWELGGSRKGRHLGVLGEFESVALSALTIGDG